MNSIAIADRMPEPHERDSFGRCWWGLPVRNDPETGERYGASWDLREFPYDGCTEWMPATALQAAHWADEHDTYPGAARA